jgi:hypothetical protein
MVRTKEQISTYNKKYYYANLEKYVEKMKRFKAKNPGYSRGWAKKAYEADVEKFRKKSLDYTKEHQEECRERCRLYRMAHQEDARKNWRIYYEANRKKLIFRNWIRGKRFKIATPGWASMDKISIIYQNATDSNLSVDHIIPLKHHLVCGLHVETNMQLLSKSDNSRKKNRWHFEIPIQARAVGAML